MSNAAGGAGAGAGAAAPLPVQAAVNLVAGPGPGAGAAAIAGLGAGLMARTSAFFGGLNQRIAAGRRFAQFYAYLRKPREKNTIFRLILAGNPLASNVRANVNDKALKDYLDAQLLSLDSGSLKLQQAALVHLANCVLQYKNYYAAGGDVSAQAVIKAFIYWRSTVNYHRNIKQDITNQTLGVMTRKGPLMRPPSVIALGGTPIEEFDNSDARVLLAILTEAQADAPADPLVQFLTATLGGHALSERAVMNPVAWDPPAAGPADLVAWLQGIPNEARKLSPSTVDAANLIREVDFAGLYEAASLAGDEGEVYMNNLPALSPFSSQPQGNAVPNAQLYSNVRGNAPRPYAGVDALLRVAERAGDVTGPGQSGPMRRPGGAAARAATGVNAAAVPGGVIRRATGGSRKSGRKSRRRRYSRRRV